MPRPHRPNTDPVRNRHGVLTNHPRQETRQEAKARKRAEAEARNAGSRPQDRRRARLARQAEEAAADRATQAFLERLAVRLVWPEAD